MNTRSVAVLGAGTMGAQIAAHVANAGIPVLLLDVTADAARQGLDRARGLKPDPFFTPDAASLITTGAVVGSPRLMNRCARVLAARKDMADLLVGVTGDFVPASAVLNARYLLSLFVLPAPRPASRVPRPDQ